MTTTLSGPILKSVADIAKALGVETFQLSAAANSATMCAIDPAGCMLIEAVLPTPAPVPEPIMWRHDTKRFVEAAKPFFADGQIEVETKGALSTFKVGRRKRSLMGLDARTDGPPIKVPRGLPWVAEFDLPHVALKRMLADSDSVTEDAAVILSIKGGELTMSKGEVDADRYEDVLPAAGADCESFYTDNILAAIIKPCTGASMRVQLGSDLPVAFHYEVAGGTAFALAAPRTERTAVAT